MKNGHARGSHHRALPPPVRRIVVADDDSLYRVGVHHLLDGLYPGAEIVDARSAEALSAALSAAPADLVLVDLGLPGLAGYLAIRTLIQGPLSQDTELTVGFTSLDGD